MQKRPPSSHTHRVCFKSIKVVQMRENLSNGSKKRKLDQDGKRHFPAGGTTGESGSGPVD